MRGFTFIKTGTCAELQAKLVRHGFPACRLDILTGAIDHGLATLDLDSRGRGIGLERVRHEMVAVTYLPTITVERVATLKIHIGDVAIPKLETLTGLRETFGEFAS